METSIEIRRCEKPGHVEFSVYDKAFRQDFKAKDIRLTRRGLFKAMRFVYRHASGGALVKLTRRWHELDALIEQAARRGSREILLTGKGFMHVVHETKFYL